MFRAILGVIIGYLVKFFIVDTTALAAGNAVGSERLINPQTNEISMWFIVVAEWPIELIGAIVGGLVAALIAGSAARDAAVRTLVLVVLIIGFFSVAWQFFAKNDGSTQGQKEAVLAGPEINVAELEAAALEAQKKTGSDTVKLTQLPGKPLWDGLAVPVVGAIGILLGGGLASPRRGKAMSGPEQP